MPRPWTISRISCSRPISACETAAAITEKLRAGRFHADITVGEAKEIVAAEIDKVLEPVAKPLAIDPALKPHVILVVGVNGTGKTTTIGKLAAKLREEGKKSCSPPATRSAPRRSSS